MPLKEEQGQKQEHEQEQEQPNNETRDSEEGGEPGKNNLSRVKSVGFFNHKLKHIRRDIFSRWILTTSVLMASIVAILSIYWACLFRVEQHLSTLVFYVVDMDAQVAPYNTSGVSPLVGPIVTNLARSMVASGQPTLGWGPLFASDFDYDPIAVRQAVYDFEAWGAIIINANATALLYEAVQSGNTSYDAMGAMQLVYMDSRDDTNWYDFINPAVRPFMAEAIAMVGKQWSGMMLESARSNTTLLANMAAVPQAISPAVGFSEYNLRPFVPYQTIPAVSVGLIYLIILSFFAFGFYLPIWIRFLKPEGHPPLRFVEFVVVRWGGTVAAYLFISLAYSLVPLAFQINFGARNPIRSETLPTIAAYGNSNAYGHGTFMVYWMLNFVGMAALGLASENVAMVVGQPWTGLWLIIWVITNVSTAFYDIDVEAGVFYYGYGFPLHQIVEGSRSILFDLHSRIGLNFGILFAWAAVNSIIFPAACYFVMFKRRHGWHEYWA